MSACPEKGKAFVAGVEVGENVRRICFNCGSTEHRLANCQKPRVNGAWWRTVMEACALESDLAHTNPCNHLNNQTNRRLHVRDLLRVRGARSPKLAMPPE